MKTQSKIILLFCLVSLAFTGCKKDSDPSASEVATNQLTSKAWNINSVTIDGVDATSFYSGLTLSFTPTAYTTTNGKVVWPATGTWLFTDDTAAKIRRDDGVEITIVEVTETTLKLSFTWANGTYGQGRTSSVSGVHVFTFN